MTDEKLREVAREIVEQAWLRAPHLQLEAVLVEKITAALTAALQNASAVPLKVRECLEFYAQGAPVIGFDRGERAREALSLWKAEGGDSAKREGV
jgi:hypothetical protein